VKPDGAIAAIDCGTNSTRLLVVDESGAARVREMVITRLGESVDSTGVLSAGAMARTLDVLGHFHKLLDEHDVRAARVVATSAVRDAENGESFLESASSITGVSAEVLSGDEEGRLSYLGATADFDPPPSGVVVLDIGGGSTEIITERDSEIVAFSTNLGCVRLTERYLLHDPPTDEEVADAVRRTTEEFGRAAASTPAFEERRGDGLLVGLAGTVSTLASLDLGLAVYDRDAIHHHVLRREVVERMCHDLGEEAASERATRPGMTKGREDVIFGGALVLREAMRWFAFEECLVSESDILEGLVLSQRASSSSRSRSPSGDPIS
jgi:exopolyphosphatase/guanosine-5'-triphosphate,3'-diphosphate pyrophosphatase